ncbi:MAG: hypothetical protein U0X76_03640 [Bacteroidia bacterium]
MATLVGVSPKQVYWYIAAIGGTLLYTGTNFTTPVVSSITTYYAEAGYTCRSQRTQGHVIVTSYPSAPTTAGAGRCGPGSVTLQAISPELINWYDAPAGGTLVGTGDARVTPSLSFTTIYYAEAEQLVAVYREQLQQQPSMQFRQIRMLLMFPVAVSVPLHSLQLLQARFHNDAAIGGNLLEQVLPLQRLH